MSTLTLVSALIAIVGLAFTATGIRRLMQRRFLKAAGLELTGFAFLFLASSSFLLASNLYTYQRLTYEQAVAEISFQQLDKQQYRAEIKALDSDFERVVDLNGDEWQLDSQVLTWQGLATLFGLDANYRLHRISGRYLDISEEQQKPRSVFSLVKKQKIIEDEKFDLWAFAHKYQNWLNWVDATYGSAVFLPMTDGARYQVSISRTGLIARPANKEARQAVSQWIGS
ncbi:MAG: cation/multidrug efflux pump [Gammaproteobacteria bacterium]